MAHEILPADAHDRTPVSKALADLIANEAGFIEDIVWDKAYIDGHTVVINSHLAVEFVCYYVPSRLAATADGRSLAVHMIETTAKRTIKCFLPDFSFTSLDVEWEKIGQMWTLHAVIRMRRHEPIFDRT